MDGRTRMWRFRHAVTRYVDPVLRPVAGRLPAFGIVSHRGRKTGRMYKTPVNVFRRGDQYLFFLTYGSDVQWVQNILTAGGCTLRTRGREVRLVEPELIADPELSLAPPFVRFVEKSLAGVTEVLRMRSAARARVDVHELRRDELALVSQTLTNRSPRLHRERFERQERGVFTYLIAWHDERPIGHAGIDWPDDRQPAHELEWGVDLAVVHDLEVIPAERSMGFGRTLMLELEDRVRARGLSEIGLGTGLDEGYAAARQLYRSLGYAERSGTVYIESSRSTWEPPSAAYVEIVTNWFKTL
jgi:deazaflavin-dependent oxidoreductase (nitroreductase family)